jgi:GDSL-like Lipase/Acylhydrolase family
LNIVLFGASVVVACLIGELALRAFGFSYPNFYTHDEHTGARLRSSAEGWFRDEGEAYVRINSDGLRDREHGLTKSPATVRIAVLGDSYAEALQLPIESTFWGRLEANLKSCRSFGGRTVEVINFGVSGYSTAQELLILRHYAWRYQPDIVLLAFLSGNDVRDNSKNLSGRYPRPFFVFRGEELVLDVSYKDSWIHKLKSSNAWNAVGGLSNHVRLLQLLNKVKNRLGQPLTAPESKEFAKAADGAEIGIDNLVYREPDTLEWREAWEITEGLMSMMNREVRQRGAKLFVVSLTNGIQVHPDPERRKNFARNLRVQDLFYPDRRIEALARREGIPFLMLGPPMQRHAEYFQEYLHGFPNTRLGAGHWNARGHELASQLIAEQICSITTQGAAY